MLARFGHPYLEKGAYRVDYQVIGPSLDDETKSHRAHGEDVPQAIYFALYHIDCHLSLLLARGTLPDGWRFLPPPEPLPSELKS